MGSFVLCFHFKYIFKFLQNHGNMGDTKRIKIDKDHILHATTRFQPKVIQPRCRDGQWVDYRGKTLQPPFHFCRAEEVAAGKQFDLQFLPFRNPNYYLCANIHDKLEEWENINASDEVLDWVKNGINVSKYFQHFKGNFKGQPYDSNEPPRMVLPNSKTCIGFEDFIIESLEERLKNGSMSLVGRVGECEPPYLVMPLTIEPTKPRLCHDERFLNLWIKDMPFVLDTLKDVPRVMNLGSFMTSVDDKSGYDHIGLTEDSRKYFGVQFGGWYFTYNTIPFGFKASAYIYHTMGLAATGYCRDMGVSCLQYIDDRLVGEIMQDEGSDSEFNLHRALAACYIICEVLTRLGYFINLQKSVLQPCQVIKFLGMLVDTFKRTFRIPSDKRLGFILLREKILQESYIDIKTLQRFAGKCISLTLVVPAARLYIREVNRAISIATKNSRSVQMKDDLRQEIEHWRFIDNWDGFVPWRSEKHLQVEIATDASLFRWGAVVGPTSQAMGDFFSQGDTRPIHVKEADALFRTLSTLEASLKDHRVDAKVDNKAVVAA